MPFQTPGSYAQDSEEETVMLTTVKKAAVSAPWFKLSVYQGYQNAVAYKFP